VTVPELIYDDIDIRGLLEGKGFANLKILDSRRGTSIMEQYNEIDLTYPKMTWNRNARRGERLFGIPVETPYFAHLNGRNDIFCVNTIESASISKAVRICERSSI